MKFNATLCSTDGNEPWAANVDLTLSEEVITTKLKTSYAHYKNISSNRNVVIVVKNQDTELIVKGSASVKEINDDKATLSIQPTWTRVVENGKTRDIIAKKEMTEVLDQEIRKNHFA